MRRFLLLAVPCAGCVPHLYTKAPPVVDGVWEAPDNGWSLAEPPADLEGEGWAEGEVPPDFRLRDQNGDEVSLWQFWGNVVVVDVSTMWCAPCRELAEHTRDTQDDYGPDGFVYVTVLQQDVDGAAPDTDDLGLWAGTYDITTSPVIGDGEATGTGGAVQFGQFPAVLVLDRGLAVRERVNPPTDENLRAAIEAAL